MPSDANRPRVPITEPAPAREPFPAPPEANRTRALPPAPAPPRANHVSLPPPVLALAILLLLPLSFALQPNFSSVEAHNSGLAASLTPFPPDAYSGIRSTPAVSDPVEFFALEIFTAMPSVDNRVSSNRPPKILWGWSEGHRNLIEQTTFGAEECSSRTVGLSASGEPYFESLAAGSEFEGRSAAFSLLPEMPNPFETGFSSAQLEAPIAIDNSTNKSIPQLLRISMSGVMVFPYSETTVSEYRDYGGCIGACNGSWLCTTKTTTRQVSFSKSASAQAEFLVENGNLTFFLLAPILSEQLRENASLAQVIFSKRLPAQVALEANASPLALFELYNFSLSQDALGIMRTNSSRLPAPQNFSEKELFILPKQLQNSSEAFSHAYALNSSLPNASGKQTVTIFFTDHFGDIYSREYELRTRGLSFLHFDNSSNPALTNWEGDKLDSPLSMDSLGAIFKGDDFHRPSAASPKASADMQNPLAPLAPLFLLIALFAGISQKVK